MGNMLRLGCLVLLVVAACSPVKDASNVPDAPVDSTDMRPPMIASSVPEDMATKVSVLAPISVFFDEALDPASVTAETVKLGYDDSNIPSVLTEGLVIPLGPVPAGLTPVRGTVSYDPGPRKVSFVPAVPLPRGRVLTLSLDVNDTAGIAFTGTVHFITYVNEDTRQYYFNGAGLPSSWSGYSTDMAGWITKRIAGSQPGIDTIWFSADDPRSIRYDFDHHPDGRISEERYFNAGPDGRYDTLDDPMTLCISYRYDAEQVLQARTYSVTIGPDNMWCTSDDVPSNTTRYTYEGTKRTGFVYDTDPGADNTWHTTDDQCAVYYDFEYDAQGRKTREIYRNCGADGFTHSADDTYNYYYQYDYDANGYVTSTTYFIGPGADTQWLTGDDQRSYVDTYRRDPDGQLTETLRSTGAGADLILGNADDSGGPRTVQTYNAQKLVQDITVYYIPGPDGLWGTDDDVISYYDKLTYDVNGNRVDQK